MPESVTPLKKPLRLEVPAVLMRHTTDDDVAPEWYAANAIVNELQRLLPSPESGMTALCMAQYVIHRSACASLGKRDKEIIDQVDDAFIKQVVRSLRLLCVPPQGTA